MSIQSEHDRNVDIDQYTRGKRVAQRRFDDIRAVLDFAVSFKTKYPDDQTEVNQGIAWIKTTCQTIIDTY